MHGRAALNAHRLSSDLTWCPKYLYTSQVESDACKMQCSLRNQHTSLLRLIQYDTIFALDSCIEGAPAWTCIVAPTAPFTSCFDIMLDVHRARRFLPATAGARAVIIPEAAWGSSVD